MRRGERRRGSWGERRSSGEAREVAATVGGRELETSRF